MPKALILKITLEHRKPLTRRRLAVPTDTTYAQLHLIIQAAFAWDNDHLYGFYPAWNRALTYEDTSADPYAQGTDAATAQILPDLQKGTVQYTYDFGESWDHRIELEEMRNVQRDLPICLAGRGAGFYEDGLGAREEAFDLDAVNNDLRIALVPDEQMVAATSAHLDSVSTQNFSKQLALFEKSPQRAEMAEMPSDVVSVYVRTFGLMMQDLPLKQWTKTKLKQGFDILVMQLSEDPDSMRNMLIIAGDFVHVMAEHHELAKGMTPDKVDDLMGQVIMANGLMPDDAEAFEFPDGDDDQWDDDPELDHAQITSIIDQEYGEWFSAFFQSEQWLQIDYHDQTKAKNLIGSFIGDMISQNSALIVDWQPAELTDMMLDFYPSQVLMDAGEMTAMAELLVSFVDFLHLRKAIAAKPANRIIKTIRNNAQHMIELNDDPEIWGPAKEFALQMHAAGVDMNDSAAVDAFIAAQNAEATPLSRAHVDEIDGRKWRQATATMVHRQVAELMEEAQASLADTMIAVDFADAVYAQFLLTPLKWEEAAVAGTWQRQLTQLNQAQREDQSEVIADYLEALSELRSMSKKHAQRLITAMEATTEKSQKIVAFKPR